MAIVHRRISLQSALSKERFMRAAIVIPARWSSSRFLAKSGVDIATLACPIESDEEYYSRDVVKVVADREGNALYFSRAAIPYGSRQAARRHVGLYGYQSHVLRDLATIPPTELERAESLEQLRALQNGF